MKCSHSGWLKMYLCLLIQIHFIRNQAMSTVFRRFHFLLRFFILLVHVNYFRTVLFSSFAFDLLISMSCNKYTQNLTWIAHLNLISSPFRHIFSPNASVLWNLCIMRQYKSSHFHCSKTKCACEITWDFPRCSKVHSGFTWIFVKTLQFSSLKYFNGKVCKVDSTTVYSFFWRWHEKRSTLQWEHPLANRNNFYIEILLSIFRSNLILPQLFAEKPSIKIMHVHGCGCGCVYPATKTPCQHPKYFVQYQNFPSLKISWMNS